MNRLLKQNDTWIRKIVGVTLGLERAECRSRNTLTHQLVSTVNRNHSSHLDRDPIDRWAHIYTFVDIFRYDIRELPRGTNVHHDCDKIRRNEESIGPREPYLPRKHSNPPIGKLSVISRWAMTSPRGFGAEGERWYTDLALLSRAGRLGPSGAVAYEPLSVADDIITMPQRNVLFTVEIHLYYILII